MHPESVNTTRSQPVALKDKTHELDKPGVIYRTDCRHCEENHDSETERNLGEPMTEHER